MLFPGWLDRWDRTCTSVLKKDCRFKGLPCNSCLKRLKLVSFQPFPEQKINNLSQFDYLKFMFFLKETYGRGFMKHGRKKGNCQDSAFFSNRKTMISNSLLLRQIYKLPLSHIKLFLINIRLLEMTSTVPLRGRGGDHHRE